jgi:hypothetical protein
MARLALEVITRGESVEEWCAIVRYNGYSIKAIYRDTVLTIKTQRGHLGYSRAAREAMATIRRWALIELRLLPPESSDHTVSSSPVDPHNTEVTPP